MPLPDDLDRWVAATFSSQDVEEARTLLAGAVDHEGVCVSDRLRCCAAVGSRGDIVALRELIGLLRVDWRDVIVAGEYEMQGGELRRVRDLTQPM